MTPKLVRINLWRYAFVWRYDTTNRKPHAKKHGKNTVGPNDFTDFEKIGREHHRRIKTILAMTSTGHPG